MITTDIEKEFFEVFDIKPVWYNCDYYKIYKEYCYKKDEECKNCKLDVNFRTQYPSITPENLLQLICVLNSLTGRLLELCSANLEDLKEEILQICISNFKIFKSSYKRRFISEVQKIFER